ncbi:VIT1/CCC1 transporter family protein [bacterium]|nr:VIT1/CCC1 transporter family protein [bacterium]
MQLRYHNEIDPHKRGEILSDVILGGQDGLVNTLGVILGVAAASGEVRLVIAVGLAAAFAESIAMGAAAYSSMQVQRAYYESERQREYRHLRHAPDIEREEIREIYAAKGFKGALLERIVEKVTSDPEVWVNIMMAEEHRLSPVEKYAPLRSVLVVFLSALLGSLIPLFPFFFVPITAGIVGALAFSVLALFLVGVYKARTMVGHPLRSGLEMAAIGMVSALVGYGIGWLFKVPAV